ncbi:MAG: hypothetical protein V7637_6389 [Mycobacteriales bacterium]|jgi:hypothetical protein
MTPGFELGAAIGPTDRGRLWRASREGEHDRIVRVLDPKQRDEPFQDGLRTLGQRQRPNLARIVGDGFRGNDYYVEYAMDKPWQTLEERLAGCAHWADRLAVLDRVCDVLPHWWTSPVHPLGLNLRTIVLTEHGGTELAWLLPCPPVAVPTPRALFDLDTTALAALAPEQVRGVGSDDRAQDAYALGTLAAQALADRPAEVASADRVAAQARGALLGPTADRAGIAPALRAAPPVRQLFQTIARYRHTTPGARPQGLSELRSALREAADRVALAEWVRPEHPDQALRLLADLARYDPAHRARGLRLAAAIHVDGGEPAAAVHLLRWAVADAPDRTDLRRDLCDARWELFRAAADTDPAYRDDDALLVDLALRKTDPGAGATPYVRAAAVYRRRGDLYSVAEELYAAVQADGSKLDVLYDYAACLVALGGDKPAVIRGIAVRRIRGMVAAGILTEKEGTRWESDFDALLG